MANYKAQAYQYETSPRKLQPEYEPKTKKKNVSKKASKASQNKKAKKQAKYSYKPVVYIAIGFAMLFTISYRNSLINESYNEKESIKSQVSAVQKENEQLKVGIENSLNLSSVEKAAQETLGMKKLDNNQKVYLDLQKQDYVESSADEVIIEEETSWLEKIIERLTQIIK